MALIKTTEQIEKIRYSSKILAKLLLELKTIIKPGVKLIDIDEFADNYIRSNNGIPSFIGFHGYPNATCISVNEDVIHGIPTKYSLKEGDIVGVDVGMSTDGCLGDTAYTYAVGEISDEKKKLIDVTEKSLYIGIEKAIKGNRVGDISNAIQVYAESNGFSLVREYCGHGVGLAVWEEPSIPNVGIAGRGMRLRNGMVIAIEPMVNIGSHNIIVKKDGWTVTTKDKKSSAHFEHTILINDNNPEILTKI
ncbi:MAG: type I methionyl aminopeptidase [Spirochaetota bacterium]|nr:type I methionyl aminopeptidase [Spirochaetota bacterium]